jgi:hypothetical protein
MSFSLATRVEDFSEAAREREGEYQNLQMFRNVQLQQQQQQQQAAVGQEGNSLPRL